MQDKKYMQIIDEQNRIKNWEILLTFKMENNNLLYIIYTDNTYNQDHKLNIYAGKYNPFADTQLEEIKTLEEWLIVEQQLKEHNIEI